MSYDSDADIRRAHSAMLIIRALDPNARLEFSDKTNDWWVSSHIGIGGDGFMMGVLYQHANPNEAVMGYLAKLKSVQTPKYVIVNTMSRECRFQYRWNGAAFARVDVGD